MLKLSIAERFRRNLHPTKAWYVVAYCMMCRAIPTPIRHRMIGVMSARVEYDTTSFVMFLRPDGTPYRH